MMYKVTVEPLGREVQAAEGSTLMEVINSSELEFDFPCGGKGRCGKCRAKIVQGIGQPTAPDLELLSVQEIEAGIRLACMTKIHGDLTIELPNYKRAEHNILVASDEETRGIEPHLKKISVEAAKPSLDEHVSDWQRLKAAIAIQGYYQTNLRTDAAVLRQLPETIRNTNGQVTAVMEGNNVLGIEPQDTTGKMLGMAFDIGTTTIVGYLLDLYSGEELSVASTLNPQTKYGADVISRISFANQDETGLEQLHAAVIEAVDVLIGEAVAKAGVDRDSIYAVTFAANTTMHHLFLGISPRYIAVSPYVSVVNEPISMQASELNIHLNKAGKIYVLPNIAGFVGADTTAVLLATELERSEDIKLIIDIGTNGEIALGSKEKIFACSAAAGPAFEGAQITSGMRGAAGAIDHVYFKKSLEYSVIGGVKPQGICGSALLDTVAGLVELGIIDKRGKFLAPEKIANPAAQVFLENIIEYEGQKAFLLVGAKDSTHGRTIMVTQDDIRQLQLAKGAMAAGVRVLTQTCGIETSDIKEVLLAGAFGNYLNPHSACAIGLIPFELEDRIKMIGNAAGTGAKIALLSASEYHRAGEIAEHVGFVELGSYPKFNSIFAECTYFQQKS